MIRLILPAAVLVTSSACIALDVSHTHDYRDRDTYAYDAPPVILDAEAWCDYDNRSGIDTLVVRTTAVDPDGYGDVVAVWADFYAPRSDIALGSAELYPTSELDVWSTRVPANAVGVNCYRDGYSVDIFAYDNADQYDAVAVWAEPYPIGYGY